MRRLSRPADEDSPRGAFAVITSYSFISQLALFSLIDMAILRAKTTYFCEVSVLVKLFDSSTEFHVKQEFSTDCWTNRCLGKLQEGPFQYQFRIYFSSLKWMKPNANIFVMTKKKLSLLNSETTFHFEKL